MKLHEKIYALRKQQGMTQNDLAEKLGVSRQAVSRWEMGTAVPDVDNLIAMSELFSVSLDELLKSDVKSTQEAESVVTENENESNNIKLLRLALVLFGIGISLFFSGLYFGTPVSMVCMRVGAVITPIGFAFGAIMMIRIRREDKE